MLKPVKKLLFPVLLGAILTFFCCTQKNSSHKADLFFENGVIYTADKNDEIVQTLAVKDSVIVFAGSAEEGKPYKEGAKEVIDLKGGMLLPGFIDGHIHTITPAFFDFVLLTDTDVSSVLQTITKYIKENPNQEVYYGFGFNLGIFKGEELEKGPKKERLDEICSDKPVIIYALDGHSVWMNSKGFEYCKISKNTVPPVGGEIVKNNLTGELWGSVHNSAMALVPDPVLSPDKLSKALQQFQSMLNSLGYTSIMTLPGNDYLKVYWEGYHQLEQAGLLTLRVRGASIITPYNFKENLADIKELRNKYNSDLVKLTAAKIFADGILGGKSAYLLQPYYHSSSRGEAIWKQDDLNNAYATLNKEGFQVHTHAIGDAAVRMALDAAEYAKRTAPGLDCRNVITHIQLADSSDFPRFKDLNVIPVLQPYWHFKQPGGWMPIEYAVLGERAETEYPLKSLADKGAMLVFSSDFPVTNVPNPFYAIEIGVTRNLPDAAAYGAPKDIADMDDPTYLLNPKERLDVKSMIRGYTANAAYSIFADKETGTLETGKSADMVVIDQNLFSIDPLKISDTKVLRTYFKGKLVYKTDKQ